MPDGQAQRVAPVQGGMREKSLAAGIDGLEQLRVEVVQGTLVVDALRMRTETDGAERRWRQALESGGLVHPGGKLASQRDVLADVRRQPPMAEIADDHPQLEGPEAPAELHAPIHVVCDVVLAGCEVVGHK